MEVSLSQFIKSGLFGQISLGDSKEKVCQYFNSPEEQDDLKKYDYVSFNNNLELKFNDNKLVLVIFFTDHAGVIFINDKVNNSFYVNDLEEFENMNLSEFENYCFEQKIKIKKKYSISNQTGITTSQGIYVSFEDDILTGISALDIDKI